MKLRLLVVFVLLSAAMLMGQTFRGTILGTVTDPSGAVVAGATVKVRNVDTGLERTTATSASAIPKPGSPISMVRESAAPVIRPPATWRILDRKSSRSR